jgi:predicted CXXCH cytochrome family protein
VWRTSVAALAGLAMSVLATVGGVIGAEAGAPQATTQPATTQPSATQPTPPELEDAAEAWARASLFSGLIGSKHDFTQGGRSGRDLCLPCHTPHLMGVPPPRLDRRATTTQLLRPYQGPGIELTSWSLLCLGCHDGVTAPDVYSSAHAVAVSAQLGNSRLGTRGLRSHPVGVPYPSVDERFEPRAAVEAAGLLLADGHVQCTTCHDAHNTGRHGHMLRVANDRSRLCVTCHRL